MSSEPDGKVDLQALLGDKLLFKAGDEAELRPITRLNGSYVAIYFSAHWCPPCRQFTPQLIRTYHKLKAKVPFEVVFVSSDQNMEAFSGYFGSMPWAAVPFGEHARRKQLSSAFGIRSIPTLILMAPDGTVLDSDARHSLVQDPDGLKFPWQGSPGIRPELGGMLSSNKIIIVLLALYLLWKLLF